MTYYYCDNCEYEDFEEKEFCPKCDWPMVIQSGAIEMKLLNEVISHE